MEWSAASASKAYLDTIKLCLDRKTRCNCLKMQEPGCNEFLSALAAGMKSKLIVEVASNASTSTLALAAAAKQTGGRFVCIVPEQELDESRKVLKESGLKDMVEFETADPSEALQNYKNIDFTLVDCNKDGSTGLLKLVDVNPTRSVVVANNLVGEKKGLEGHVKVDNKEEVAVRSMKHPIGEGMEITVISKPEETDKRSHMEEGATGGRARAKSNANKKSGNGKWVVKIDKKSGEEHIFRVTRSRSSHN